MNSQLFLVIQAYNLPMISIQDVLEHEVLDQEVSKRGFSLGQFLTLLRQSHHSPVPGHDNFVLPYIFK